MSRRPALVTKADVRRVLEAAKAAEVAVIVEITPNGAIRLLPSDEKAKQPVGLRPGLVL